MGKTEVSLPLARKLSTADVVSAQALIDDLGVMGIGVELNCSSGKNLITFEYDPEAHKRNAGRKRICVPIESHLCQMSQEEMDEWLLNSSIETIIEELQVSRSTVFRRRAEARERILYAVVSLDEEN